MLRIDESAQNIFNSATYRVSTPDGTMFVNIMEDRAGLICAIDIHVGKSGSALRAWVHCFSRLMTMALEHGATLEEFLTELSSQNSDKSRSNGKGIEVRSGPDGVYHALMQYRGDKFRAMQATLGIPTEYQRPKILRRN